MSSTNHEDFDKYNVIKNIQFGNQKNAVLIENKDSKDQYLQVSKSLVNDFCIKLSNNPSFLKIFQSCDDESSDNKIQENILFEYPKNGTLADYLEKTNSNATLSPFTPTQKLIFLFGIATGIQHLHINNLYHGDLNSRNIFLDENLYPHIYLPKHENDEIPFEAQNINEIKDLTSFSFIAYEIFLNKKIFTENSSFEEKMEVFDLSLIDNEWQKSFLKSLFPRKESELCINNVISNLMNNIKEFGDIEEDKFELYLNPVFNYQTTYLEEMQNKAESDAESMLIYGRMLLQGYCTEFDKKKAVGYFKKASISGNIDSLYEYGMMLKNGDGIQINKGKALLLLNEAADRKHSGAIFEYGHMLMNELHKEKRSQGFTLIKKAADMGYVKAQLFYGYNINGISISDKLIYYKTSADFGCVETMNDLYVYLSEQNETEYKDCQIKSLQYLKMAASLEFPLSMLNLGKLLINGDKIPQNIEKGVKYIKMAADQGFLNAIICYSLMLLDGENVEQNKEEAAKYIKIGADKGNTQLMNLYGLMLQNGDGVEKDLNEAARYFQLGFLDITQKNNESMFLYGKLLMENNQEEEGLYYIEESLKYGYFKALLYLSALKGKEQTKTQEELINECKNSADEGNVDAMLDYALILYNGEGVPENKEEAARYYQIAAEKGNIVAMHNYAMMLFDGDGIEQNKSEAAKYFQMAADKGHDISNLRYGLILYSGDGIEANKDEAISYIKRAKDEEFTFAVQLYKEMVEKKEIVEEQDKAKVTLRLRQMIYDGDENAMFTYAIMLLHGKGIYKSRKAAAKYFKMAAEKGHLAAMYNYAMMLATGNGIKEDKMEAAKILKSAADKGHCASMNYYAVMLSNGDGIKKNKKEAAKYYRIAASQNHKVSMNNYGIMLCNGDGIEKNQEAGLKYLKRAAQYNDDVVKFNYRVLEYTTSSDKSESIKCIKMSADEGNNNARLLYGNCLYAGDIIPMDKKEAARYFKLAADDGSIDSLYKYAEMVEKGDGIPLNIEEAIECYQKILLKKDPRASPKLKELQIYYSCCY